MIRIKNPKYNIGFVLLLFLCSISLAQAVSDQTGYEERKDRQDKQAEYVPGHIIVKMRPGTTPEDLEEKDKIKSFEKICKGLDKSKNLKANKKIKDVGLDRLYLLKLKDTADTESLIRKLQEDSAKDSAIEYAEPDYIITLKETPNDPYFSNLWGIDKIDAPEAWDIQKGNNEIIVAVIDTGVDYTHSDLVENMWVGLGYDFCNGDEYPMDDHGHGTHCAGTIGAVGNNEIGVIGVSPHVSIMALKFLDATGSGYSSAAVSAILYATTMGADIMSNSWGGSGYSQSMYDAISAAGECGILFVAAAGNSAADVDATPFYPAGYDCKNIISVAATDVYDGRAYFSNWGLTSVDLGAPGLNIFSTIPGDSYGIKSGTSMACPHVSGSAALVKAQYPDLTADEIKARILGGVDYVSSMEGITVSGGRLNVNNALEADFIPPAAVTNLSVTGVYLDTAILSWTATADDGAEGAPASSYDLRYSTEVITEDNWDASIEVVGELSPSKPGEQEVFAVEGLDFGKTYYFALKVQDNVGNPSGISNIAVGETEAMTKIFEGAISENSYTMNGLWHFEASDGALPSLFYNSGYPLYTYNTGAANSGTATSNDLVDLSGYSYAVMEIVSCYETETSGTSYDKRFVRIVDADTGSLTCEYQLYGDTMLTWNTYSLDIPCGNEIKWEFYFNTVDSIYNDYKGWGIAKVTIYVPESEINKPPVAVAGEDQTSYIGKEIQFNGSGSYDPDEGQIVSYEWNFGDGSYATGMSATHSYQSIGEYEVTLTVTDDRGAIATDTLGISILNMLPVAVIKEVNDSEVGAEIQFNGSGSYDPDGTVISYLWDFGDGTQSTELSPAHTYWATGGYTATLTVIDNNQGQSTANVQINIGAADEVGIEKAEFDNKKNTLVVYATSTKSTDATLELKDYGTMEYVIDRNIFTITVENIYENPGEITVVSSWGGEATKEVDNKFKK